MSPQSTKHHNHDHRLNTAGGLLFPCKWLLSVAAARQLFPCVPGNQRLQLCALRTTANETTN